MGAATDLANFVGMLTRVGSKLAIDDVQQRPIKQAASPRLLPATPPPPAPAATRRGIVPRAPL